MRRGQPVVCSLISALPFKIGKQTDKDNIILIESVTQGDAIAYSEAIVKNQEKVSEIKTGLDGAGGELTLN